MKEAMNDRMIRAWWFLSNNFGDSLNYFLISALGKREVVASVDKSEPHFIVCGSILSQANKNSTVWGAGFSWRHHKKSDLYGCENVIAVRGDLSAERVESEVKAIGDPALLLKHIYHQGYGALQHGVGIIPHWTNISRAVECFPDRYIINPMLPIISFIDAIRSCEYVFSESLHGLIVADTYGVPNARIDMGAQLEDGFKFDDYYSSTVTPDAKPIKEIDIRSCQVHKYKYDLNALLKSCPFYGFNN